MNKKIKTFLLSGLLFPGLLLFSQSPLLTRAELSDFKSTSTYNDVVSFIETLEKSSPCVKVTSIGKSVNGYEIPLLILADPLPDAPQDLEKDKRIVIYIQANIHADEVEGKESSLMFARDILKEKDPSVFKNLIILICPVFNIDGNEKISNSHRTYQNGPVNGVGLRYNGQSLDLNRDAMKAESPELKGLISEVFNKWDPAVFMDCHTTNGSFHVEPVTFTWMPNPDGDTALIGYMKRKMAPSIAGILLGKYKTENCFYGEFVDMLDPAKGWLYEAVNPRYLTNYYGLRNRLGILNENYVYADFRSRVEGCYNLMRSLVDFVIHNKNEIKEMLAQADQRTIRRGLNPGPGDSIGIEFNVRPAGNVTIKTYEAELLSVENGWPRYKKTDRQINVTVPYLIDYYPSKSVKFPYAYLMTVNDPDVVGLLKIHGIKIERLIEQLNLEVEKFEISEIKNSGRLNQGHYFNSIKGMFVKDSLSFPPGTIVVKTSQPLANIAAYLLEPQSNDGLVAWNFFDKYLVPQWGPGYNTYPVYKVINKTELKTEVF